MAFIKRTPFYDDTVDGDKHLETFGTVTEKRDPSGQTYIDPNADLYQGLPEGMTYPAPSLAPKEAFKDPSRIPTTDISPVDYKQGNTLDPERTQRNLVRSYLEQKYGKAASSTGLDEAKRQQERTNTIADFGHGLDRMFTAHSAASGGQGVDNEFWKGMKQDAAGKVSQADADRKQKIADYLMQQNLGRQGVEDLSKSHEQDRAVAMQNPNSEISQTYQTAFAKLYPEYAEGIEQVPAADINNFIKMAGQKSQMALNEEIKRSTLESNKANRDLRSEEVALRRDQLAERKKENDNKNLFNQEMVDYRKNLLKSKEQGAVKPNEPSQPPSATSDISAPADMKLSRDKDLEYNGGFVFSDGYGNYFDGNKNLIKDTSKIKKTENPNSRPPTAEQGKSGAFWDRSERAESVLKNLEANSKYTAPTSGMSQYAVETYMMSDGLTRQLSKKALSNEDIQFANANMAFINAILRKDSGAAIPKDEYAKYKYLLPEYGDSAEVLQQKRVDRENMINALSAEAGTNVIEGIKKGRVPISSPSPTPSPSPSNETEPEQIKEINGIKYKKVPGGWRKK